MMGGVVLHLGVRVGVGIVPIGVGISFGGGGARSSRRGMGGVDMCGGIVALLCGEGSLPLGGLCFGEGGFALGLEDLGAFVALGVHQHGPLGVVTTGSPGHKKPRTGNRTERTGNRNRKNRNRKIRFLFGSCSLRTEIPRLILG
jgi:hypothetical protein